MDTPTTNSPTPETTPTTTQEPTPETTTPQPDKLDKIASELDGYFAQLPICGRALAGIILGVIGLFLILLGSFRLAFFCGLIGLALAVWGFYARQDSRGLLLAAIFCGFDILIFIFAWLYYYKAGGAMWGFSL